MADVVSETNKEPPNSRLRARGVVVVTWQASQAWEGLGGDMAGVVSEKNGEPAPQLTIVSEMGWWQ